MTTPLDINDILQEAQKTKEEKEKRENIEKEIKIINSEKEIINPETKINDNSTVLQISVDEMIEDQKTLNLQNEHIEEDNIPIPIINYVFLEELRDQNIIAIKNWVNDCSKKANKKYLKHNIELYDFWNIGEYHKHYDTFIDGVKNKFDSFLALHEEFLKTLEFNSRRWFIPTNKLEDTFIPLSTYADKYHGIRAFTTLNPSWNTKIKNTFMFNKDMDIIESITIPCDNLSDIKRVGIYAILKLGEEPQLKIKKKKSPDTKDEEFNLDRQIKIPLFYAENLKEDTISLSHFNPHSHYDFIFEVDYRGDYKMKNENSFKYILVNYITLNSSTKKALQKTLKNF